MQNERNIVSFPNRPISKIPILLVDRDHSSLLEISQVLTATGMVKVVGDTTSFSLVPSLLERHRPEFVFLSVDSMDEYLFDLIAQLRRDHETLRIVVLSRQSDANSVLQSFRAGADEYLQVPLQDEEVTDMFTRLRAKKSAAADHTEARGKVLAFLGSRGGCGTTTLACNIAHQCAQAQKTILVDLNAKQGDLAMHLDIQSAYSLRDVFESEDSIDETYIESIVERYSEQFHLLVQPKDLNAVELTPELLEQLVSILQKMYDIVVLDLGREKDLVSYLTPYLNRLHIIVNQNLPSVCLAAHLLSEWDAMGLSVENIQIVINAYDKKNSVTLTRIAKTLKHDQWVCIRKDEKRVESAINQGVPLQEISRWGKSFRDIKKYVKTLSKDFALKTPKKAQEENQETHLPKIRVLEKAAG